jgi:hypothetical protein
VVNRADRTPVAVGPTKIRSFDNGGREAVTKPSILQSGATSARGSRVALARDRHGVHERAWRKGPTLPDGPEVGPLRM